MTAIGYTLSAEEAGARELVAHAARAEEVGFPFAVISDHFHPWIDRQGQSPFVWGVLGAISKASEQLELAPTARSAAATSSSCRCQRISKRRRSLSTRRHRRERRLRAGPRPARRGDRGIRGGRIRPRLRP